MADHLKAQSLDWALTHIQRFGDTDLFPVPFEYIAIKHSWLQLRKEFQAIDLSNYECRPSRRFLVPKPSGGFRVSIQLDPIDALLYSALVYEAAELLESQRVSKQRRIACSYRLEVDQQGRLFSASDGWGDFADRSSELAQSGDFSHVTLADISDFYNQISHHRIRNILETSGVPSERAKNTEKFLMNLTQGQSRGIPVGPSASILLAEGCLADVDAFLLREGYTHVRYVDDFRVFCKSRAQAYQALHDLSEYLYSAHRLALRPEKIRPLVISEFISTYLIDPERLEEQTRKEKLQSFARVLRDFTGYHIEVDDIPDEDKQEVVRENLAELFDACLSQEVLHLGWARYLLRQATFLKTNALLSKCLENLEVLVPAMRDVGRYLVSCSKRGTAKQIGGKLVSFAEENAFGGLPFVRLWALEILTLKLSSMYEADILQLAKESSRMGLELRTTALLARERGHVDWVRKQKETWQNSGPWDRRAIIWAGRALSKDERNFWIKRIEKTGDPLDRVIARAVAANL